MLVAVRALHVIVPTVTTFPVADSAVNIATIGLLYPTVNPAATSRPCDTYTVDQKLVFVSDISAYIVEPNPYIIRSELKI